MHHKDVVFFILDHFTDGSGDFALAAKSIRTLQNNLGCEYGGYPIRYHLVSYDCGVGITRGFLTDIPFKVTLQTIEAFNRDSSITDESYAVFFEMAAMHHYFNEMVGGLRDFDRAAWGGGMLRRLGDHARTAPKIGKHTHAISVVPEYSVVPCNDKPLWTSLNHYYRARGKVSILLSGLNAGVRLTVPRIAGLRADTPAFSFMPDEFVYSGAAVGLGIAPYSVERREAGMLITSDLDATPVAERLGVYYRLPWPGKSKSTIDTFLGALPAGGPEIAVNYCHDGDAKYPIFNNLYCDKYQ